MSTLTDTSITPVSIEEADEAAAGLGEQVGRARAVFDEFRTVLSSQPSGAELNAE